MFDNIELPSFSKFKTFANFNVTGFGASGLFLNKVRRLTPGGKIQKRGSTIQSVMAD
jgi:hypothetical protein